VNVEEYISGLIEVPTGVKTLADLIAFNTDHESQELIPPFWTDQSGYVCDCAISRPLPTQMAGSLYQRTPLETSPTLRRWRLTSSSAGPAESMPRSPNSSWMPSSFLLMVCSPPSSLGLGPSSNLFCRVHPNSGWDSRLSGCHCSSWLPAQYRCSNPS
jgi:hypothetical protein